MRWKHVKECRATEWLDFIAAITTPEACTARTRLTSNNDSRAALMGSPVEIFMARKDALLLLWVIERIPATPCRDINVQQMASRHLNVVIEVINRGIDNGLIDRSIEPDIRSANASIQRSKIGFKQRLNLPRAPELSADEIAHRSAEDSFQERNNMARNTVFWWTMMIFLALWLYGFIFFMSSEGNINVRRASQVSNTIASYLSGLRSQVLPLTALLVTLVALPSLNSSSALSESREKRGQQLLLQRVTQILLFIIGIASFVSTPIGRVAVATTPVNDKSVRYQFPVSEWIITGVTSIFCALLMAVFIVAQSERVRISQNMQSRISRIDGELEEQRNYPPRGDMRRLDLLATNHWQILIPFVASALPGTWLVLFQPSNPHLSVGPRLGHAVAWILLSTGAMGFYINFFTYFHLRINWNRSIDGRKTRRFDAATIFALFSITLTCGATSSPLILSRHHILLFFTCWLVSSFLNVGYMAIYPKISEPQIRRLRTGYLCEQRKLAKETLQTQRRYLG